MSREMITSGFVRVFDVDGHRVAQVIKITKPHDGLIPPPGLKYWDSEHQRYVEFVYAGNGSQESIAAMYGVTQQTVSRWLDRGLRDPGSTS